MKGLVVCNSLDHFLPGVTRRHLVLSIHGAHAFLISHRKGKRRVLVEGREGNRMVELMFIQDVLPTLVHTNW